MEYPEGILSEYRKREYDEHQEEEEELAIQYAEDNATWHCERCGVSYEIQTVPDKRCEHCGDRLKIY